MVTPPPPLSLETVVRELRARYEAARWETVNAAEPYPRIRWGSRADTLAEVLRELELVETWR